ncbi:MAG: tRNA (adenosine(37)-N6)-threonylcarbamoyltransferase complex transferase subunit TsaD [bacterium]|nr:tRNA (adenosine(37)-N6)-threonylcarbamoyltransferase complex transferase subunit TsaD [bacterium]
MLILGIETSCDETAASVVMDGKKILSNVIATQTEWHKKFGGIVPEIASRKHIELINPVIREALNKAKIDLDNLSGIAVTFGPGLVGSLLVGIETAKAISYAKRLPLLAINHLEGHIYAVGLKKDIEFPAVSLIVSGGHTELVYIENYGNYELLGRTRDDAAGEAFDKISVMLNLGYPGGPIIDRLSKKGNKKALNLPLAKMKKGQFDFSFSGLKTAVINYLKKGTEIPIPDLVASFQEAVVKSLVEKTIKAARVKHVKYIILCGGVAANSRLREKMQEEAEKREMKVYFPHKILCTDNAAMIAGLGYLKLKNKELANYTLNACPNLKLG